MFLVPQNLSTEYCSSVSVQRVRVRGRYDRRECVLCYLAMTHYCTLSRAANQKTRLKEISTVMWFVARLCTFFFSLPVEVREQRTRLRVKYNGSNCRFLIDCLSLLYLSSQIRED